MAPDVVPVDVVGLPNVVVEELERIGGDKVGEDEDEDEVGVVGVVGVVDEGVGVVVVDDEELAVDGYTQLPELGFV